MKGRIGCGIHVNGVVPNRSFLKNILSLGKNAVRRMAWFDWHYEKGENASKTCRYFGINRKTFYKYKRFYDESKYHELEDKSKRPHNIRKPETPPKVTELAAKLRDEFPSWSKYKLSAVLQNQLGIKQYSSPSTVGRILKREGLIDSRVSKKRRKIALTGRRRLRVGDKEVKVEKAGDLVQMDTKEYRVLGEGTRYQFTAVDCFSRKRKLYAYGRKTALCGKEFLMMVIKSFPFPVKRIQTDGGGEWLDEFDRECRKLKIEHFFSYPKSPQQNAFVESSHSTDEREFYGVNEIGSGVEGLRNAILEWEEVYNSLRPHQSLNMLTPDAFLKQKCLLT